MKNKELYKKIKSNMGCVYFSPITFRTSEGIYLEDIESNKYIDFTSGYGVVNIGWQNKKMIKKQIEQISISNYAPPWMPTNEANDLAEKLKTFFPNENYKCLRATGGANANEMVLSIFYNKTKGEIATFNRSYHGWSQATIGMSESDKFKFPTIKKGFESIKIELPISDSVEYIEEIFNKNPNIKIFIAEPILVSGGVIIPSKAFWNNLYNLCKNKGIYFIFDEAITAFGRTGYMFYSNYLGINPDAIVLAKGISSGYSTIGAVLVKEEHLKDYKFADVSATFSWTPFSCAIAKYNIDIIEEDSLCENSLITGDYLKNLIEDTFKKYFNSDLFEIRSSGLVIGVDLINKEGLPNLFLIGRILFDCAKNGLVLCTSWDNKTLIFMPPLCINKQQCDAAIKILDEVLAKKA